VRANHLFAGVAVSDYAAARAWYEDFFGREPDLIPNQTEACWQLGEGAWFYIDAARDHAGSGFATLLVDDLGRWGEEADESVPGMRRVEVSDPDGNRIQLAQPLS
jgi:catechol 2,3-dioxygenase-like lactoylglutathione lyase family enzyme